MNLAIILHQPYPYGMACTNRIQKYAKGFQELGARVCVLVPRPTETERSSAKNKLARGIHEGIEFAYTCGTTFRGKSFVERRLLELKGFTAIIRKLIVERKSIDTVLLVSNHPVFIIFFWMITASLGMIYLQEKSELPFYNSSPRNIISKMYQYLYTSYIYKCFDGILVISTPLYQYFKPRIRRNADLLLVPAIVDIDEFAGAGIDKKTNSIVYCGNFTQSQDGILTLIEAFKSVAEKVENISLCLVGDTTSKTDKENALHLIEKLHLEDKVVLTGYVSREKLRELLCQATMLVLAKPTSRQADYCFPSKLTEYLATASPVLVTKVGIISEYLRDGVDAFLVEPDNSEALARKMEFILSHPDAARQVGFRGRETAVREFAYKTHARRIFEFSNKFENPSR